MALLKNSSSRTATVHKVSGATVRPQWLGTRRCAQTDHGVQLPEPTDLSGLKRHLVQAVAAHDYYLILIRFSRLLHLFQRAVVLDQNVPQLRRTSFIAAGIQRIVVMVKANRFDQLNFVRPARGVVVEEFVIENQPLLLLFGRGSSKGLAAL